MKRASQELALFFAGMKITECSALRLLNARIGRAGHCLSQAVLIFTKPPFQWRCYRRVLADFLENCDASWITKTNQRVACSEGEHKITTRECFRRHLRNHSECIGIAGADFS